MKKGLVVRSWPMVVVVAWLAPPAEAMQKEPPPWVG
jgi:hypothetical protein